MTDITQCPQCSTRFKVSKEQQASHQGMVRCGRCQAIFNAASHLYDDTPSPQLDLPIEPHEPPAIVAAPESHAVMDSVSDNADTDIPEETDNQDFSYLEDVYEAPRPVPQRFPWPLLFGSVLLLLLLGVQTVYFYRVDIAARHPGLKPVMLRICAALQCNVPLPQQVDLLSIESSALEADPTQANVITLSALLRNRAPYAMAYPNIELTLTNFDDKPIARRTFRPTEYLAAGDDEKPGLPANRETSVKLHLNTTDLKPAGYRLYLLYPQ